MSQEFRAIRGMHDVLPSDSCLWQYLEERIRSVCQQYGYQEIRLPILENTALFERGIGDGTDVIEKEMYTFTDKGGDSLSLRPEGTAGCVRAAIEHGMLRHQVQRLWYLGPMFRYERPQRGRYRQFYSLGVEAFGVQGALMDLEVLALGEMIWHNLGLSDRVFLQINTLGTLPVRQRYRELLVEFFQKNESWLDEESRGRLHKNPLRILDSKNPALRELIDQAPKLLDCLDESSKAHFEALQRGLALLGIAFEINPCLVRGLDYYSHTVFEWVTKEPLAQSTVCGGGRYDGLVELYGAQATPAVGFGLGMERVLLMLKSDPQLLASLQFRADIYVMHSGVEGQFLALQMAQVIRQNFKACSVVLNCGSESLKNQFKKADQSQALLGLVFGESEVALGSVAVKFLRDTRSQIQIAQGELVQFLSSYFSRSERA